MTIESVSHAPGPGVAASIGRPRSAEPVPEVIEPVREAVADRLSVLGRDPELLTEDAVALLAYQVVDKPERLLPLLTTALFLASTENAARIDREYMQRALDLEPSASPDEGVAAAASSRQGAPPSFLMWPRRQAAGALAAAVIAACLTVPQLGSGPTLLASSVKRAYDLFLPQVRRTLSARVPEAARPSSPSRRKADDGRPPRPAPAEAPPLLPPTAPAAPEPPVALPSPLLLLHNSDPNSSPSPPPAEAASPSNRQAAPLASAPERNDGTEGAAPPASVQPVPAPATAASTAAAPSPAPAQTAPTIDEVPPVPAPTPWPSLEATGPAVPLPDMPVPDMPVPAQPTQQADGGVTQPLPPVAPRLDPPATDPPPTVAPAEQAPAGASPAVDQAGPQLAQAARGGAGLLLLALPGDTLPRLYRQVYRGLQPPPYAELVAANPAAIRPGALVLFPAPPGGWRPH